MVCSNLMYFVLFISDGTVSYNMHQGERRGTEVNLLDVIYDGRVEEHYLSGGLGQLTDGQMGDSNFRLDEKGMGIKGYEWVGWRNETHHPKNVEVIFKFDMVRNFTKAMFFCNNFFSKDVRVFKSVKMWFSIGGELYLSEPVYYRFMRDTLMEFAREVIVPMDHRVGQFIKMEFEFDAKWMMISEVQFLSGKVKRISRRNVLEFFSSFLWYYVDGLV